MENLVKFMFQSLSYTNTNVFLFLSFIFMLLIITWKKIFQRGPQITGKLPPGPTRLPLIGNIHQLAGAKAPHVALRDVARKYGPLVYMKLGQVPMLVVSSAEMAREVLSVKDPAFADRPNILALDLVWYNFQGMASPYGEHWKQLRKICVMDLLSGKNVRSFSYIREDETAKLVNKIRSNLNEPINITNLLYSFSCSITCRAAFGNLSMSNEKMIKWLRESLHLAGGFHFSDLFPSFKFLAVITGLKSKLLKLHKGIDLILEDVLNQHKSNHAKGSKCNGETGDEDLIDVLLRVKETGSMDIPISEKTIKAAIFDIFTGGTDTAAATVEWAMSELMRHPEVRAKAQKEVREVCKGKKAIDEPDITKMTYIKMVIKETLRLHPPAPILPRACREDCQINGLTIPKNTQLSLNVWAISRDPDLWDDPESFKPERFEDGSINFMGSDFQYIPFGAGRRMCPGVGFGVANVEISVAHLLFHFNWSLPSNMKPEDLDMEENFGLAMARKNNLKLVATTYNP